MTIIAYHVTCVLHVNIKSLRACATAALLKGRGEARDRRKAAQLRNVLQQRCEIAAAFSGSCGVWSSKCILKQASRFSEDQRKTRQVRFGIEERTGDIRHFPASCAGRARARVGGHQVQ